MSGILAQYAQNIERAADNVQNAYAAQAQVQAEGARATQAALAGIKESFDKSEQMKLEQQRLDTEKELATQRLEEEGKFLKTIALTDKVGDPAKAMQIVNSEIEQARAQRAANAPKHTSLSDLIVGGTAAAGAGAAKLGKKVGNEVKEKWNNDIKAFNDWRAKRKAKKLAKTEQGQKLSANFSGADTTPSALQPKPTKADKLKESLTTPPNTQALSTKALTQMPNPKGTPKGYGSFTSQASGLKSLHDTTTPLLK